MGKLEQLDNLNPERKNEMPWWEVQLYNDTGQPVDRLWVRAILENTACQDAIEERESKTGQEVGSATVLRGPIIADEHPK
jgi:hypothetical protein